MPFAPYLSNARVASRVVTSMPAFETRSSGASLCNYCSTPITALYHTRRRNRLASFSIRMSLKRYALPASPAIRVCTLPKTRLGSTGTMFCSHRHGFLRAWSAKAFRRRGTRFRDSGHSGRPVRMPSLVYPASRVLHCATVRSASERLCIQFVQEGGTSHDNMSTLIAPAPPMCNYDGSLPAVLWWAGEGIWPSHCFPTSSHARTYTHTATQTRSSW